MGVTVGSQFRHCSVLLLALSGLGCASRTPESTPSTVAVPSAAKAPARPDTSADDAPHLRLEADRILLGDRPVASVERGRPQNIDSLSDEMKALRKDSNEGSPRAPYHFTVADGANGAQLKSAIQTAAGSGWPVASLDLGGKSIAVHAVIPGPPGKPSPFDLPWPDETLVLVVRTDSVELLRAKATPPGTPAPAPTSSDQPSAAPHAPEQPVEDEPAQSIAAVEADNVSAGLPSLLRTACEHGSACSPAILIVADDAPFSLVNGALQALATLPFEEGPAVQLRLRQPQAPGTPLRVRVGAAAALVSGRLDPKLIQETVRANFKDLRQCYEAGLGRNANLTGRISVRFVIGRDGRVPRVIAADGTTMPDTVVTECVLGHFRAFQFPRPEDGIVTVVYPIMFAPSE